MKLFVNILLLQYISLTYAVDATAPINPTAEELHKVVMVSKSEFMKPIKRCEINKPSDSAIQNTYNIVRACDTEIKRYQLFN